MTATDQRVRTAQVLIAMVCLVLVVLIGRLAYIQSSLRPELLEWSQRRQSATITLGGRRGGILDRRHRVLAGSQDLPTFYADPRMIEDLPETARDLARFLSIPEQQVRLALEKPASPGYAVIRRGADAAVDGDIAGIRKAAEHIQQKTFPGVGVIEEPVRSYPMGPLASHVIGFVGADGNGLEGIELACERYLRATPGQRVVFCDSRRRALFQAPDSFVAPKDGMQIVLTLDSAIQETVERELAKAVAQYQAESAVAIMMSPKTGEVLAMCCVPSFSPDKAGKVPPQLRRNRLLTDPVEPGSIFKPFVMAAALEAGVVRPTDRIDCSFGQFGGRRLHDSHAHGVLTAEEVVGKSSNIGMAVIGQRLGNRRMHDALARMGFGRTTGFDLPGEGAGLFMPLSKWNTYTTTSVPMGQEVAVTPMQIISVFCSLVNGGKSVKPYAIAGVLDHESNLVEDRRPTQEYRQVLDPSAAATIKDILIKVVLTGTGKLCQLDRWQVMGKTGTAQVPRSDRKGYEPDAYLGSFIAAAPAADPAVAVLVMIRKPNKRIGYYGATVALPVVKAILEQTLTYLNVPPDKTASPRDGTRLVLDAKD